MNIHSSSPRKVKSACPYCGVGCGIVMDVTGNRITKVSGDKDHTANRGRLCTKGMTSAQAITVTGRLDRAFIRASRNAEQGPVALDAALDETAGRLKAILDTHGPDAIALYVSGQMSLEAQYLANKLAKGFIRTKHIESNSRLCMASAASGYKLSLGADGPPGSYDDIDKADLFLVIGSNMADCHPVLFLRMMDRIKQGARLIVVDPRRTETAAKADLFLQIRPGTDLALLNCLLNLIVADGRIDRDFIAAHTEGWQAMPDFLEDYGPETVAALTGLSAGDIRTAAVWIGEAAAWTSLWTMGLNQSTHGTWNTNALCNLHLATGKVCKPGSGPFSLTGQPNAMGGREMGYMGAGLPGQRSALVEADRTFTENLWSLPPGTIRPESGNGTIALFEQMREGAIKACWIICTNPVASVGNRATVIAGLKAAELVITQDVFLDTETNIYADILLPGALWAEAEGVMVNSERNMTLMEKAVDPPGEARPDWWIIAEIAKRMGYVAGFSYASASEIFDEIRGFANPATGYDITGASHARLGETPLQWPVAEDAGNRNPVRYVGSNGKTRFPTESGKARFFARPHLDAAEMPDEVHPFILNTGRVQHQWHTMTKTGKIPALTKLNPGPFIEISPSNVRALGVEEGDRVEIRSRRGFAILPAVVTDRVLDGNCFAPFHWNDIFGNDIAINAVTCDVVDPVSLQPELKFCAVSLTRMDDGSGKKPFGGSPAGAAFNSADAAIDAFSKATGVTGAMTLALEHEETLYLEGFVMGLRAEASETVLGVPVLPVSAPLSAEKRLRLNGFLAGLFSREAAPLPAGISPPAAVRHHDLTILWASQTGTAEALAKRAGMEFGEMGVKAEVVAMDQLQPSQLKARRAVAFVASTFGDGDPPDNGAAFWNALQATEIDLAGLSFAVLCLGDSSYGEFCGFGRRLDAKLEALGGKRLMPRIDCDGDGEAGLSVWLDDLPSQIAAANETPRAAPAVLAQSKTRTPGPSAASAATSRRAAQAVKLIGNRRLNGPGSAKETRQFVFDLSENGLSYEPGDALGVWPANCPDLVAEILYHAGIAAGAPVTVPDAGEMAIDAALRLHYEIARITPDFLAFVAARSRDAVIAAVAGSKDLAARAEWLNGRQIADVLATVPLELQPDELLAALKRLQPRFYSISSSLMAHPGTVQLTVSTVRYDHGGRTRKGACSTYLADRAEVEDVPVFVRKSPAFRLPTDKDRPIIMVGPGTGVAPFRGFLAERAATGASGRNWLFFGEQHCETDFYYRDELEDWQKNGVLTRLDTAFSRDGAKKVYVQDKMTEEGADLWRWLEDGASIYVCGDASRMAKDVDQALRTIVETHGEMSADRAGEYVATLVREKRYLRDVY